MLMLRRFLFIFLMTSAVASSRIKKSRSTHVRRLDLILYGATGCVGHLTAEHLANQKELSWAIAGINETTLQELADKLAKGGGASSKPEIIVSPIASDPSPWVRRAKAVLTAAGPFSKHGGELVVKSCAENGVHYSDTSDEFYWQREMIDGYHAKAASTGAKIILASGFCVLAGDLGSRLALEALPPAVNASSPDFAVDAWLEGYNGGLSAGVINTGKAIKNASYPKEWNTDPYVLAPQAVANLRVDSLVDGMKYPGWVKGEGAIVANIFGSYDARLLRRSFTQAGMRVNLRVGATPSMYAKWTAFVAVHPGSWSSLAKCPSEPILTDGSWSYRFQASSNESGRATVVLQGKGDPGYHFTSWGLAEVGLCLAGVTPDCLLSDSGGGVSTAMSVLNVSILSQRLIDVGLLKVR